mgnify:CR=1 FL=1
MSNSHENIDKLINKIDINEEIKNLPHKDAVLGIIMGLGGGNWGTGSKFIQNILTKIKARNARGLRNLREGQGTGAQSMSSSDRAFLNKEWDVWNRLKDLIK